MGEWQNGICCWFKPSEFSGFESRLPYHTDLVFLQMAGYEAFILMKRVIISQGPPLQRKQESIRKKGHASVIRNWQRAGL